jgi:hypothetical protein
MRQEALRERLLLELDLLTTDVMEIVGGLGEAQLGWKPPGGGWSVGQVLEHVVIAAESYVTTMRPIIYRPGAPVAKLGEHEWDPSLAGSLLVASFKSKRRFPAPRIWRVDGDPRPGLSRAFLDQQATLLKLLRAAADLDWTRIRFSSPVSPMIRLNLGDGFAITVVHGQRHALQMERLREMRGFPQ